MHTTRSFKLAMIVLILFAIAIVGVFAISKESTDASALLIGLPIMVAGVLSVIGCWHSIKSFKEPRTGKKYLGLFIHFASACLFGALIVANVMDLARWMKT